MFVYKKITLEVYREIRAALLSIYGIGKHKALFICARMGLIYPFYISNLNTYNWHLLVFVLDYFTWLEIRIKRILEQNIKKYHAIQCYRGIRHSDSLPVRGQRTRSNARTKKRFKIKLNAKG